MVTAPVSTSTVSPGNYICTDKTQDQTTYNLLHFLQNKLVKYNLYILYKNKNRIEIHLSLLVRYLIKTTFQDVYYFWTTRLTSPVIVHVFIISGASGLTSAVIVHVFIISRAPGLTAPVIVQVFIIFRAPGLTAPVIFHVFMIFGASGLTTPMIVHVFMISGAPGLSSMVEVRVLKSFF